MAEAPMDMLRKCRDQFAKYASEHRKKAADTHRTQRDRDLATMKAVTNESFVTKIEATLKEWG